MVVRLIFKIAFLILKSVCQNWKEYDKYKRSIYWNPLSEFESTNLQIAGDVSLALYLNVDFLRSCFGFITQH